MGLDSYLYGVEKHKIAYRRGNWKLHEWIVSRMHYTDDDNCRYIELDEEDLDALEAAIKNLEIKEDHEDEEEYIKNQMPADLQMIEEANMAIQEGKEVFYYCWY